MSEALQSELRLPLAWELWVVEHLLFGAHRDALVDLLAEQGIPRLLAEAQVRTIEQSPGLARLQARVAEGALAAKLQRLDRALQPLDGVPTCPDIAPEALWQHHWAASRPLKLTQAARQLQAVQRWSLRDLADRFGTVEVPVNVGRAAVAHASETERVLVGMSLAEFVALAEQTTGNDAYIVSRCGLLALPALRPLWDDLTPLPAILQPVTAPTGASLWIGPAGTVTPPHFDPHNVLLIQVQGRKRVRLAPRIRADQHALLDGYYLRCPLDEAGVPVLTVELAPGEALFVPAAWLHEVTALEPSMTLSMLSFPWPNHFHDLGPPGSADPR